MRVIVLLVLLSSWLSGCVFLAGDDDDDDEFECQDLPVRRLRDPESGLCVTVGHVGAQCQACGNCVPDPLDVKDRADCGAPSRCEGLLESSCLDAPGCRTVYSLETDRFLGCWGTAPTEVVSDGTCAGLDAHACSHHTNCSAWYAENGGVPIAFDHCDDAPPRAACELASCEPGTHCVQDCPPCDASGGNCSSRCHATCAPDEGCDARTCALGTVCRESCVSWGPDVPPQCHTSCQDFEAGSPGQCDGPITCAATSPACPAGTITGRAGGCYTGFCIPATACATGHPGTCESPPPGPPLGTPPGTPPACPDGTVAGTFEGAYTGYCIPLGACGSSPLGTCDPPGAGPGIPPACADGSIPGTIDGRYTGACVPANQCPLLPCDALVTEPACAARPDCRAVDLGGSCTCNATDCTCTFLAFGRCESAVPAGAGG